MEANNRSECIKHASISPNIQNGDSRGDKELHLQRGMGSLSRSNRRVLPHSHMSKVTKSSACSCRRSFVSVQSPTLWYSNSST